MNEMKPMASIRMQISAGGPSRECGDVMCEKCDEIDVKLERYRRISLGLTDRQVLESIQILMENMKAEKAALHPESRNNAE